MSHVYLSYVTQMKYGVALASRIDKIIGFFCKRALCKWLYSAKDTYNLIDPTDHSHPIYTISPIHMWNVVAHMNECCHIWISHVPYKSVMSCIHESCEIYEWVMSHTNKACPPPHMNESCHIWMSHVTYEWFMPHMNESCHIRISHFPYERVMS